MPLNGLSSGSAGAAASPPSFYLPPGWDAGWRAAKAGAGSAPAWITCLGDSVANGFNSSDPLSKGWFELVRAAIIARGYAVYGDYYGNYAYSTANLGTGLATPPPWGDFTAGTKNLDGSPYHKYYNNNDSAAAWHQTFTAPYACTALDLIWWDQYAGTWQYRIDGGTPVTLTNSGAGTQASVNIKRVSITGLANATHTVDIGFPSAVGAMGCPGVAVYANIGAGIGFARWQYNGAKLSDYAGFGGSAWPGTKLRLVGGIQPQSSSATTSLTGFGFPTEPSLLIVSLCVNDANNNATDPKQYEQGLNDLISGLRDSHPFASVLLIATAGPDAYSSDVNPSGFALTGYAAYVDAMLRVAQRRGCGFIDIDARWGLHAAGLGYMAANSIHPLDAGHQDIANAVLSII